MADRRSIHLQLKVLIIPLSSLALIAFRCHPCANTEERDHSLACTHVCEQAIKNAFGHATDIELTASLSDVITPPTLKRSQTVIIKPFKHHFLLITLTNTTQSWPFHHPVHTSEHVCRGDGGRHAHGRLHTLTHITLAADE